MLLAYGSDIATGDADAMFAPDGPMLDAIREVAAARKLPSSWLNNQASVYFARDVVAGPVVFDHPFLQVKATPPEHLLAMKVIAARSTRDRDDVITLIAHLGIASRDAVEAIVARYFPDDPLSTRSRALLSSLNLD